MPDPLTDVVTLLGPRTVFAKGVAGAGAWAVRYADFGRPSFAVVLEGRCRLAVEGEAAVVLEADDFVLLPATPGFVLSGFQPATPRLVDPDAAAAQAAEIRHGDADGPPEVRLLGGWFEFGSPDAGLLVSLLPRLVHVRGVERLSALIRLIGEEAHEDRAGRELVLNRLVEVLLVEALRSRVNQDASAGLLRGLSDARVAAALRALHAEPGRGWTVAELAAAAGMSRSAFFERFNRTVGSSPMDYLASWRMAVAKSLLRLGGTAIETVAERVGYGSAGAFSAAFSRHVGLPPGRYAREAAEGPRA